MEKKLTFIDILEKIQLLMIKASESGLKMDFTMDTNEFNLSLSYADTNGNIFDKKAVLWSVSPEGIEDFAAECNNLLDEADRAADAYIENLIIDLAERTARLEDAIKQGLRDLPRTK